MRDEIKTIKKIIKTAPYDYFFRWMTADESSKYISIFDALNDLTKNIVITEFWEKFDKNVRTQKITELFEDNKNIEPIRDKLTARIVAYRDSSEELLQKTYAAVKDLISITFKKLQNEPKEFAAEKFLLDIWFMLPVEDRKTFTDQLNEGGKNFIQNTLTKKHEKQDTTSLNKFVQSLAKIASS